AVDRSRELFLINSQADLLAIFILRHGRIAVASKTVGIGELRLRCALALRKPGSRQSGNQEHYHPDRVPFHGVPHCNRKPSAAPFLSFFATSLGCGYRRQWP